MKNLMKKVKILLLGFLFVVCVGLLVMQQAETMTAQAANERIAVNYNSSNLTIEISNLDKIIDGWAPVGYSLGIFGQFQTSSGTVASVSLTKGSEIYLYDDSDWRIGLPGATININWQNEYPSYKFIDGQTYTIRLTLSTQHYYSDGLGSYYEWFTDYNNIDVYTFLYDISPPTFNSLPSYANSQTTVQASDSSGISRLYYKKDNGAYNYTTSASYTVNANSTNNGKWTFYAVDTNGATSSEVSFIMDTGAPSGSLNNGLASGGLTNKDFIYSGSDTLSGVAKINYRRSSSGEWQSSATESLPISASEENNGVWNFQVVDKAGNISAITSITLDTVLPSTSNLPEYTNSNFTFSASDTNGINKIYYKQNDTSWQSTTNTSVTLTASTLNNGAWTFYAEDRAGNKSTEVVCVIDTIAPTNISLPEFTNQTIAFSSTDINPTTVYYRKGTESFASKSGSSFSVENITTNNAVWQFYAVDAAGNKSPTITCTLDTIAPENAILPEFTNQTIAFSSTDINPITVYYRKGTESFASKSGSSFSVTNSVANNAVWQFYAVDAAGNQSATVTCILDTIAPTNVSLPQYTNQAIAFSASDINPITAVYYRKGTESFASKSGSSFSVENITINNAVWQFYAVDAAGNQSATVTCTLDTIAPTNVSLPQYTNQTITFNASDTNPAMVYYRKGTESFASKSGSSFSVENITTNNAVWQFYAVDAAGNQSPTITCTLDTIAPTNVSLPEFTNQSIAFSASDINPVTTVYYRKGTESFASKSGSSFSVTNSVANNAVWQFYAVDVAGNKSATVVCTLDTIAPENVDLPAFTNQNIIFSATDVNLLNLYYKQDASGWQSTTSSSKSLTANSTNNGVWAFYAEDKAGNKSVEVACVIDTIVPTNVSLPEFTNQSIAFSASDINPITAVYYRKGTESFASKSGSSFSVENITINNAVWQFYAVDAAGNKSPTITCTLDTIAPTNVSLPEFTNQTIFFSATDTNPVTTIYYRKGAADFVAQSGSSFSVTNSTTNNAVWQFYALDAAGNKSATVTCTLDTIAPTNVSLPEFTNQTISFSATDTNPVTTIYYRKGAADFVAQSGSSFSVTNSTTNNAVWQFYAVDAAGNQSATVTCILDTIAPTNITLPEFTNQNITFSATDTNGVARLFYKLANSNNYISSNEQIIIEATEDNNGIWQFYAEDILGNKSEIVSSTMSVISTYGNQELIKNSYKVVYWYRVTLPARIFTTPTQNIAGNYTFSSYEKALEFAIMKEIEFRCSEISNGWIYVTASNEALTQIYTDKNTLDAVILKYAKTYISTIQRLTSSSNYYTTVNDTLENDIGALTRQQLELPDFLSHFSNYQLWLCSSTFVFNKLKLSYAVVPSEVKLTYIANDFALVSTVDISINYDVSISKQAQLKQGYYIVTEYDAAGNIEQYLIYIDIEQPTLQAEVENGSGAISNMLFDADSVTEYAGTFYFVSFAFTSLFDNVDSDFLCVLIDGTKLNNMVFTQGELLPVLTQAEGYTGKYRISVYDRSFNTLSFEIIIASDPPTWTYTSLANDVKLTLNITINGDKFNAITHLQLFKIQSDGTYIELLVDDDEVEVNFATLTYTLRYGGKYTARITDLFGRTVEMTPIFYQKGLPQGTLSVANGVKTNKDVTFKYSGDNELYVYYFVNGVKTLFTDYSVEYAHYSDIYTITFFATEETSFQYLLSLHNKFDDGLYIEYGFEIDCIIAEFFITDIASNSIELDAATNKPFSIIWSETLTVRYYSSKTITGELGARAYTKGTVITEEALYYFSLKDDVGNTLQFTIYLKMTVNCEIKGNYINIDNKLVSNENLVVTILEPYSDFQVENAEGYTFSNGNAIMYDGEYELFVTDNYNNTLHLIIIIDTKPPEAILDGVANGGRTKAPVVFTFDEAKETAFLVDSKGAVLSSVQSGKKFDVHGNYTVRLFDIAGNFTDYSFSIDFLVDYTINILNGALTNQAVKLAFLEEMADLTVLFNEIEISHLPSFSDIGQYSISAVDSVGNSFSYSFEIIPLRAKSLVLNVPSNFTVTSLIMNNKKQEIVFQSNGALALNNSGLYIITLTNEDGQSYELEVEVDNTPPIAIITQEKINVSAVTIVEVSKENIQLRLLKDGIEVSYSVGKVISEAGKYKLTITDELGNESTYEFEIAYTPNSWSIAVYIVGGTILLALVLISLKSRIKIKVR